MFVVGLQGCLGVVTEVTLQVEPAFSVRSNQTHVSIPSLLASMQKLQRNHEFFKAWILPTCNSAVLFTNDRVDGPLLPPYKYVVRRCAQSLRFAWWRSRCSGERVANALRATALLP